MHGWRCIQRLIVHTRDGSGCTNCNSLLPELAALVSKHNLLRKPACATSYATSGASIVHFTQLSTLAVWELWAKFASEHWYVVTPAPTLNFKATILLVAVTLSRDGHPSRSKG